MNAEFPSEAEEKTMNLIEIKDINAPEMDIFARVTERELRTMNEPHEGIFLAESAYIILRALENGYEPNV